MSIFSVFKPKTLEQREEILKRDIEQRKERLREESRVADLQAQKLHLSDLVKREKEIEKSQKAALFQSEHPNLYKAGTYAKEKSQAAGRRFIHEIGRGFSGIYKTSPVRGARRRIRRAATRPVYIRGI